MQDIKSLWENRSRKYKRDVRGVLPKSFPSWLNKLLHLWMYGYVKKVLSTKKNESVLDLGCGYGRVAKDVLHDFPKAKVWGVDLSRTYVDLFNRDLSPRGNAEVSDIRKLPYKNNFFDVVYMITTLMYITDRKEQEKSIEEIFRVLKPGGKFVFIERNPFGHSLLTLGGLVTLIRGTRHKEIDSVSFTTKDMDELVRSARSKVSKKSGFPYGPFLTPCLYIAYSGTKS